MTRMVQQTVEAPRMWYMNTIVDMLEMKTPGSHHTDKQTQKTVEVHQVPFPERVEGGEQRCGCPDQDCVCDMV